LSSGRPRATASRIDEVAAGGHRAASAARRGGAFSLIELLCVMAIISILASLLLTAVNRAYQRVRRFAGEVDEPAYVEEIRAKVITLTRRDPAFPTLSLDGLVKECDLSSRCAAFLRSAEVTYVPFAGTDPDAKLVIIHRIGSASQQQLMVYSKGWLCTPDQE
jgi:prepilin-type N-terminal cleavage/methylation domain-containing protein